MTYAPPTILALRSFLQEQTKLSANALGIVGDAAHARRASYHNGRDRMLSRLATDYTARTTRDRAGLTNAASALDIGNHPRLRSLSRWLVGRCRANAPGTSDIREVIYSPDGVRVLRWDRERGVTSLPRAGEADSSHLWHTHMSWYRDSERRDKVAVFRPFYVRWGTDVRSDIKAAYTAQRVATRLHGLGIKFGQAINNVDLEAGLKRLDINFGTSVQLVDAHALMRR